MPSTAATNAVFHGLEVGSLADWVSGGGSLMAVCAALIIAGLEHRRAKKADSDRLVAEIHATARVRGYLVSIVNKLSEATTSTISFLRDQDREDYAQQNRYRTWLAEVKEADERLERLSQFPSVPLDLYLECDRIRAYLSERNFPDKARQTTVPLVENVAERLLGVKQRLLGIVIEPDWNQDPETRPDT